MDGAYMTKLKEYLVNRAYVTRLEWRVRARSQEHAIIMLDNEHDETPSEAADEEWLGPLWGLSESQTEDRAIEVTT